MTTRVQVGAHARQDRSRGEVHQFLADHLTAFIGAQSMFFIATAPRSSDGHVNVSPKGPIGTFAVLGPHRVAYLDFFGNGAETVAHLQENGRIVVMFCAFSGPPRILRLHGTGDVVWPNELRFEELLEESGFALTLSRKRSGRSSSSRWRESRSRAAMGSR